MNSRFTPATNLKIGTYVLIPNFTAQKGISKKLQPLRKGSYQIIDKPTDVTYKLIDLNKKEIVQSFTGTIFYLEYALREKTQIYSFTGLKVIHNISDYKRNQSTGMNSIQKPLEQKKIKKNLTNKHLKI